jgi:uncharacterized LabA/DUF88 family protein
MIIGVVMDKVAIFVDVQNIYYTTKQAFGCHFDYNVFWRRVSNNREVVKAIAYTCNRGDTKQKEFQNILRAVGFEVKLKPYVKRADGSAKCDWDVGITIDAMEFSTQADVVVLASGDGDFELLVNHLKNKNGNIVEVYGVEPLTAAALIKSASSFVPVQNDLLLSSR